MVRLHGDLLDPLDEWIARQPGKPLSRPDAIRNALRDWLAGLDLIDKRNRKPGR